MINFLKSDVITLIKSAVTGERLPLSEKLDMFGVMKIAKTHQVASLIYYGAINCGVDEAHPAMQELFTYVCRYMIISERQKHEVNRLFAAFDEKGVDYMPLKGVLLKKLYPKEDMRVMGDADILIKVDQYDKIKPIMTERGFNEHGESDHEFIWNKPEAHIELHKHLIPSYNKDYYAYYGNGWQLAKLAEDSQYRFEMSKEDQMIYLFTHFSKHYRDGGIGLRHMTDLYVYRKANPDLDEAYIKTELKKLCLYDFYRNILSTISAWFEGSRFGEREELITGVIFSSGVYGTAVKKDIAQTVRVSDTSKTVWMTKIKRYFIMLFPKLKIMSYQYSYLKKLPFLLPFAWIARMFNILFFKRSRAKLFYTSLKNISSEDIFEYEESLHAVGLDFNFKE